MRFSTVIIFITFSAVSKVIFMLVGKSQQDFYATSLQKADKFFRIKKIRAIQAWCHRCNLALVIILVVGRKDGLQCDFLKSWLFTDVLKVPFHRW